MSFYIAGTGSALPQCSVSNDRLSEIMDTSDEWISTRTGIKSRHIITSESLTELASEAARRALESAGAGADELDLIICATLQGDYVFPALSCLVQRDIGASCPAFDINAACTGFIYAMEVADGFFARGSAKNILVIAAEAMSRRVDWQDRSTAVLFGDGAGAAVLRAGDGLVASAITASGSHEFLYEEAPKGNCPFSAGDKTVSPLKMNGQEIYKFAVSAICRDISEVMEKAGLRAEDVALVLAHQANLRILEGARARLGFPKEKICVNIDRCANTSAASIAILLDEVSREGRIKKGDIILLSAFGAGLTTGCMAIRW